MVKVTFNEETGLLDIVVDEPNFEATCKECISEVDAKTMFVTTAEMEQAVVEINKALNYLSNDN